MNRSQVRWLLVVVGALAWVGVVYPAYYVVHKPLNAASFRALASVIADLFTWTAMLVVATGVGSRLTRRFTYHSLVERLTFSAGLGLGIFSLLTLGLGLAGLLYRWLFWALLIGGGLLLWRELRDLARTLRSAEWPRPRGRWQVLLALFIAATLLLALATALVPPTDWDGLVYHLVGPQRYLQAHRLTFEFDNYYLFFPSFTEMLFTVGMALRGDVLARLVHFGYLLLTLGALAAFATRYWKRRTGLLAVALFVAIPTAVQIATWSYVDLALTFYNLAAVYAILNWLHPDSAPDLNGEAAGSSDTGWLVLSGLFAGASLSIKYTGVVTLLVLGAVLLWALLRRRLTVGRFLNGVFATTGLALAVTAPWYIKNAIVAGNPIYPLVWGGREWNEISSRWLLVLGEEMSLLDLLAVPWTLTILGTQGTVAYDATFSPLFLALLPLLLVVRRQARGLGELLLAAAVGFLFWLVSGAASYGTFVLQGRMVLPIFAPLSLLCAFSLDGLEIWDRKSFSLQRVLKMIILLTMAFGLLSQIILTISLNPWPYLVGLQSRDDYLDRYTSQRFHQAITFVNENLPPDGKVLFAWEPRSYGTLIPHEADVLFDNFAQRLARHGSPEAVVAGLREEGFTHVLVNRFIYPWIAADYPITPEEKAGWEAFQSQVLTEEATIHAEGEYFVLYVLPEEATR